jgi:hypothetical protein
LQAYLDGKASSAEVSGIRGHLEDCPPCREVVLALVSNVAVDATAPTEPNHELPADVEPGEQVGRYIILNRIGAGGMGVVYAAHDPELDRKIALKLIRRRERLDGGARDPQERLIREAQAMARITHPNVTAVHDVGRHGDQVYVAMELISGETLAAWLAAKKRSPAQIVDVFRRAGEGLRAAHVVGLVHRDFKPNNVMIDCEGRVRVLDFGLARPAGIRDGSEPSSSPSRLEANLTASGVLQGTPAYMAPEQLKGKPADARSDQYSFCVALWEALCGTRPFAGSIAARLGEAGARPRLHASHVPGYLLRALKRGLAAEPEARFATMEALLNALAPRRRALAWLGVPLVVVLVVVLVLVLGATALMSTRRGAGRAPAPQVLVQSVRRLTFARGCESWPSFTRDGHTLIYDHGEDGGDEQLYALDLDSGRTRQLTQAPGGNEFAKVSPDGKRIAYFHDSDGPRQLRVMPLDGSAAPHTIAPVEIGVSAWLSPSLVVVRDRSASIIGFDVDAQKPEPRVVQRALLGRSIANISAFRDGALAVVWQEADPFLTGVGVLAPDSVHTLAEHIRDEALNVLAAPSQQAIYFSRRNGAVNELVRVPRGGGALEAVGGGIVPDEGVSISPDGKKLAFSTCRDEMRLVRFDSVGRPEQLSPNAALNEGFPAALDERHLLFTSNPSDEPEVSQLDVVTHEIRSLGEGQMAEASHDQRWMAYALHKQGGIWLRPLDGSGAPRRLTNDLRDTSPRFSHDDRQVIFVRGLVNDDSSSLWIVPVAGGEARLLVAAPAVAPMPSAADDRIFYLERSAAGERLMFTREHAQPQPAKAVLPATGRCWGLNRSRDGRRILVARDGREILELDVDSERPPLVKYQLQNMVTDLSYAADDHQVIASMDFPEGDVWLAEGRFP